MASDLTKAGDDAKHAAASGAKKAADAVDAKREKVADAIDDAADRVGKKGGSAPEPANRYSRGAKDKLHDAADYVRDTDVEEMGHDAMRVATAYPLASILALGAVVIGGSMLVASLMQDDGSDGGSGDSGRPMGLKSAANGLGPKGTETLIRVRDAAFTFILAKTVEMVDEMYPGFREHFDRA
jgi:hypothetical protein